MFLKNVTQTVHIFIKTSKTNKLVSLKRFSTRFYARPKPVSKEDQLSSIIPKDFQGTNSDDWLGLRKKLCDNNFSVNSVDFALINYFCAIKKYDLGIKYWKFLQNEKLKPSLAATGRYLHLLYLKYRENDNIPENEILDLYQNITKEYDILDAKTSENIAEVLSLTKHWEKSFDVLNDIKITNNPSTEAYSAVISAAFKNSQNTLGWSLAKEMIENNKKPHSYVYSTYFSKISKTSDKNKKIEDLFNFLQESDIILDENEARLMVKYCNELCKSVVLSKVDKSKICNNCSKHLKKLNLTEEEFIELKNQFMQSAIIGKNIFSKTNPNEIKLFQDLIKKDVKYDVVIDGLNVAYSAGLKQTHNTYSYLVASVVKHFVNINKTKILIVGRKHMRNWSTKHWRYVEDNAELFLVDSVSQDDPYLMYCALNSGNETVIVSKDLMRGHIFKLKDLCQKSLLKRWLMQNQWQLLHISTDGRVYFKYPLPFAQTAQKNEDIWHIPFESDYTKEIKKLKPGNTKLTEWICVKL